MDQEKIALVDGTYYIFRAFFGIKQRLTNKQGKPTAAIFTFKNMLLKLMEDIRPNFIVVVFDAKGDSFRTELYPDYKANRESAPSDLIEQIPYILQLVDLLGLPKVVYDGFEADDVIASLAKKFQDRYDVWMISADKDLTQMVGPQIKMYDSLRGIVFNEQEVFNKYKVYPHQIIDYLALKGDASDNIPGAKGIGEVTAAKLLAEFGSLDNMLAKLDQVPPKEAAKLQASLDKIKLSQTLATICSDVPLDFEAGDLAAKEKDHAALQAFYNELGFRADYFLQDSLFAQDSAEASASAKAASKRTKKEPPADLPPAAHTAIDAGSGIDRSNYQLLDSLPKLTSYVDAMLANGLGGIDLETTSLEPSQAKIVGIALYTDKLAPSYCPVAHLEDAPQVPTAQALAEIRRLVENPQMTLVGQNLKYEFAVLTAQGLNWQAVMEDTMLQSYLVRDSYKHGLDSLAAEVLNHTTIKIDQLIGKGAKAVTFDHVPIEQAKEYSAEDIDVTFRIHQKLRPLIDAYGVSPLYTELEIPLIKVLARMEHQGIKIDKQHFADYSKELRTEMVKLEQEIHELAGEAFNINSPKQLGPILFDKLKLDYASVGLKKNAVVKSKKDPDSKQEEVTGYVTDAFVLEKLASQYPIAQKMLDYRGKAKLVSTYLDSLPELADAKDRLHTSFHQAVAATGRLSSNNPNLQNIPIRGEEGKKVREGFIAEDACYLLSADYSQIELRIFAHIAEEKNLIQAFENDLDIHQITAAKILKKDLAAITADDRAIAKAINYGIIYGMGSRSLGENLNIPFKEAEKFMQAYLEEYPGIKHYKKMIVEQAKQQGYVETLLKRKRWLKAINSANALERSFAERVALNTPIQGTAADIIKLAMLNIHNKLLGQKTEAKLLLQVHDELVLEVPKAEIEPIQQLVIHEMETALALKVPLKVSASFGRTWSEVHN